jgi:hypothetical protein
MIFGISTACQYAKFCYGKPHIFLLSCWMSFVERYSAERCMLNDVILSVIPEQFIGWSHKTFFYRHFDVMGFSIKDLIAKLRLNYIQHKYWVCSCWVFFLQNLTFLNCHAECLFVEWYNGECCYAEWWYTECHSTF